MIPKLFEAFRLKSVTARNRIVVSPMCQYASRDGSPTDWHIAHLGRYAVGGAGTICREDTSSEATGRKTLHCAGLYRDEHVAEYRRLTDFVRSLGAVPAIQLGHAGSKASSKGPHETQTLAAMGKGWQTFSASNIPVNKDVAVPRAMSEADIAEVIGKWGLAVRRADAAGFDMVEIHGAHGYLIHQFLSPLTNDRTDGYGGDLAGRMRFALEVAREARRQWPASKPLLFRVSAVDGRGGVWSMDDTIALAGALKDCGVDVIDCSSGGVQGESPMPPVPRLPGYHVPYARRIKEATGLLTMAPGLVTGAAQAEELLQSGAVDLVAMARQLMYDSEWPVRAAEEFGLADFLDLFPPQFAFRLRDRQRARAMDINQPGARFPM